MRKSLTARGVILWWVSVAVYNRGVGTQKSIGGLVSPKLRTILTEIQFIAISEFAGLKDSKEESR